MMRTTILFVVCFIFSCDAFAQGSTMMAFDNSFALLNKKGKISSGEKIMLKGRSRRNSVKITITVITRTEEKEVQANVNDSVWTAIVGPFSPNQTVFLRFTVVSQLPQSELKWYIARILNSMATDVFDNFPGQMSPDKFPDYVSARLSVLAEGDSLRDFRTPDGVSVYSMLSQSIKTAGAPGVIGLTNMIKAIDEDSVSLRDGAAEFKRDYLTQQFLGEYKVDASELTSTATLEALDRIYKERSNPADSNAVRLLSEIENIKNRIESSNRSFRDTVNSLANRIAAPLQMVRSFEIPDEFVSLLDVSDLEKYADIDVGGLLVSNIAVVPAFTINPYLSSIFSSDSPLLDALSLGVGIGLSTKAVDAQSPIYTVGVSARLNRLFRVAVGPVVYVPNNSGKLMWRFGFSASINFRYLGDLLKIFSSVSSSAPGQSQ